MQWHALAKPLGDAVSIAVPWLYTVSVLVCQKADGEAASAKLNTLTHAYYVGILKAYTPTIYHGQDLGRGDRCGLRLKARVRKVRYLTPRRNSITQWPVGGFILIAVGRWRCARAMTNVP